MYINGGNGGGNNGGSTPSSAPVRRIRESNTRKDMKQNKKTINEAQLRTIVKEAVKSVLNESDSSYAMFPYQSDKADNGWKKKWFDSAIVEKRNEFYSDKYKDYDYKKLKTDLGQVYRLWDFLDND